MSLVIASSVRRKRLTGRLTRARGPSVLPWSGLLGAALLFAPVVLTLLAPWIAPHDPNALFAGPALSAPSTTHPLGTDLLGRDQLSRVLYGGRIALGVAAVALAVTVAVGTLLGCVAGYLRGRADDAISLLINIVLALPDLSLTLALVAVLGPGWTSLLLALSATAWADYARLFRGAVLQVRSQLFVVAAQAIGATDARILLRHVIPNVARPILALASLRFAGMLLALAGLSFLGLGVQPPTADWGTMLNDARPYLRSAPHLAIAPAACVLAVSLGANLLADALLHPRRHPSRPME